MRWWQRLRGWRREAPAIGNPPEVSSETWHRLKNWQKGLLIALCALAYIVCVAPTFTSNVLPHILASVNPDGSPNGGEITSSVYLTGTVILLTVSPLIMLHVSLVRSVALLVMCLIIGYVNINNATGTMGSARDAKTDAARQKIDRATRLDAEIATGTKAYQQVPAHRYVTEAAVKTAETALATLKKSAEDECHTGTFGMTRGPRCSDLEKRRDAKAEELVQLQADKDLTDRATAIEVEITNLKKERETLGAAPEHVDAETERFVGFLALLHIVSQDQAKAFSENKPVIDAICMELMAFIGPSSLIIGLFVLFGKIPTSQAEMHKRLLEVTQAVTERSAKGILAAESGGGVVLTNVPNVEIDSARAIEMNPDSPEAVLGIEGEELPAFAHNPETVAEAAAAAILKADPDKSFERKARRKKPASKDSVRLWVKEATVPREARFVWSNDAGPDYKEFCVKRNLTPVPPQTFGKVIKDEFPHITVERVPGNRSKYYGIGLRNNLKIVSEVA